MKAGWLAAFCAFAIAVMFTWTELRTSKYPNTGFLIRWSKPFWAYCLTYGFIALAGFWLFDLLVRNGQLKVEGLGLESAYIRALVIRLSSKAIMQLNLFTVTSGSTSFPIGIKTVVQLFEPFLLRLIDLDEFNGVREFVAPYAARFPNLDQVKAMVKQNIPASFSQEERTAFQNEIDKETQVHEAMERFLRFLGKRTFVRVFGSKR
jgi:hypothetical protein